MHKVCFPCFCSWSRKSCYGSTPSGTMVESAMRDVNTANPTAILPQPNLMQRHINRQRQETRPGHDDAGLQPGLVPHTGGLSCGRRQWRSQAPSRLRHQSLTIPAFPSCSLVPGRHLQNHQKPFIQLFGIHALVRQGDCMKQELLAFVIMSRRTTLDYASVLRTIVEALPVPLAVTILTTDFEPAVWQVVSDTS